MTELKGTFGAFVEVYTLVIHILVMTCMIMPAHPVV